MLEEVAFFFSSHSRKNYNLLSKWILIGRPYLMEKWTEYLIKGNLYFIYIYRAVAKSVI